MFNYYLYRDSYKHHPHPPQSPKPTKNIINFLERFFYHHNKPIWYP